MTIKEELKERTERGEERKAAQIELGKRVKKLIDSGKTNSEVAKELGISESSVRSVRARK